MEEEIKQEKTVEHLTEEIKVLLNDISVPNANTQRNDDQCVDINSFENPLDPNLLAYCFDIILGFDVRYRICEKVNYIIDFDYKGTFATVRHFKMSYRLSVQKKYRDEIIATFEKVHLLLEQLFTLIGEQALRDNDFSMKNESYDYFSKLKFYENRIESLVYRKKIIEEKCHDKFDIIEINGKYKCMRMKGTDYLNALESEITYDIEAYVDTFFSALEHVLTLLYPFTACKSAGEVSEEELVKLVASVESDSTHPIAKAVVNYAKEQNIECVAVTGTKEFAGYGLEATIDGAMVLVGNCRLLSKFDISYPKELLEITDTIVVCAVGNRYAGYLLLADALKEDAKVAIDNLKALNIENIQILSGDKQSIVTNFAEKLGISKAYGDLLPEGKVNHLEELRQDEANRIAFVGDGMNDAPVLALSHVGIAMGGLGSDAAIETADVVIQTDQPSKVAEAIKVGKLTRRIIWQNVSLAFGVKLLVLILGAGGIATLWEAVFADVGVALLAIMNAVRIQKMIK